MKRRATCIALILAATAVGALAQTGEPQKLEETLFVKEQKSFTPGYPIGDIAIGDPDIADFRVLPGRRELLLFGKNSGRTVLQIWDQKRVKRHEITLNVTTHEAVDTERDLRDLLKDFPTVEVRRLGGSLAVSGTVKTKEELDAVTRIIDAAHARNLVRYIPPASPFVVGGNPMPQPGEAAKPPGEPVKPSGGTTAGTATGTATGTGAATAAAVPQVEYEIELIEASVTFGSGSYATGVEPSGRPLFKQTVQVPIGTEGEVFMGGPDVLPTDYLAAQQQNKGKTGAAAAPSEIGIRLKVRPGAPAENGTFTTYLLIETNVPVGTGTFTDPTIWRRARWEFNVMSGVPVGVGGAELLAVTTTSTGASRASRTLGAASILRALPGVSRVPGSGYVPSGVPYHDKQKQTQLMVILRPRLVVPQQ